MQYVNYYSSIIILRSNTLIERDWLCSYMRLSMDHNQCCSKYARMLKLLVKHAKFIEQIIEAPFLSRTQTISNPFTNVIRKNSKCFRCFRNVVPLCFFKGLTSVVLTQQNMVDDATNCITKNFNMAYLKLFAILNFFHFPLVL